VQFGELVISTCRQRWKDVFVIDIKESQAERGGYFMYTSLEDEHHWEL
jgi:hypothetical protein